MSGDLTQALRTAHSGLFTSQQALDAVARNVANVNTPGYSRKIINLEQRTVAGAGAGVDFGVLTRRVDQGLVGNLRQEAGALRASDVRKDMLGRIQDLFGTPESNTSLSHALTDFQMTVESLAAAPQAELQQRDVVRAGAEAASLLRRYSAGIQSLRAEADQRIGKAVDEINGLLTKIADLNDKVLRNGAMGQSVADLEDTRDQAIDRLSELIDIRAVQRGRGDVVVFTRGGRTLVDNTAAILTHIPAATASASMSYADGNFDGIYVGDKNPGNDITHAIGGGELSALIEMRDSMLPDIQGTLDALAAQLRDTVNAEHNRGVGFPGLTKFSGTRAFADTATQTITFGGNTDTALVLFDANGNEIKRTTMRHLLDPVGNGAGPYSIDMIAADISTWLGAPGSAKMDGQGRLTIDVPTPSQTLAFRDEAAVSTAGSARQNAVIQFDADGNGGNEDFAGFSSFFGLNDFFIDDADPDTVGRLLVGSAATIEVRSDIAANPSLISRGTVQWDASRAAFGAYALSAGDNTVVQHMAEALASTATFASAGRLPATKAGLVDYAALLISDVSALAAESASTSEFQQNLVDAIRQKSDSLRGVNLDEELSNLMLYEQSYSAAARVVQAIKEMFDVLDRAMG
jgi:flagellar hook-associated protein 1 FlgK